MMWKIHLAYVWHENQGRLEKNALNQELRILGPTPLYATSSLYDLEYPLNLSDSQFICQNKTG